MQGIGPSTLLACISAQTGLLLGWHKYFASEVVEPLPSCPLELPAPECPADQGVSGVAWYASLAAAALVGVGVGHLTTVLSTLRGASLCTRRSTVKSSSRSHEEQSVLGDDERSEDPLPLCW